MGDPPDQGLIAAWFIYEKSFRGARTIQFVQDHTEIPIFAMFIYLFFVFSVPDMLQKPFGLKTSFAIWNLFLSAFSFCGATRTVPHLLQRLFKEGFRDSVCADPITWYGDGPVGLWMFLFIISKVPELLDTVFLVLRRKPVIFLHWYHHVTVMLYCWHAFACTVAPGLWFAAMNYSVHTVMYFYFAMVNLGFYKAMQPFAPVITTIQILQMVGGIVCLCTVAYVQLVLGDFQSCQVEPSNWKMGLGMYFSYFFLFAVLFVRKYFGRPANCARRKEEANETALTAELDKLKKRQQEIESILDRKPDWNGMAGKTKKDK